MYKMVSFAISLLFSGYLNICVSDCKLKIPNNIYDSIPINFEYIYHNTNKTGELRDGYIFTTINGEIRNDNSHFWKLLLSKNISKCSDVDTNSIQFICGCEFLKISVKFIGINDTVNLKMTSCDISKLRGHIFISGKEYVIFYDKRIAKAFKEYLKGLLESAIPRDFRNCGIN